MFIELTISAILLIILFDYLIKKRRNDLTKDLPEAYKSYPVVGGLFGLLNRTPENLLDIALENRENYGSLYKIWLFNKLLIFGTDPRDIEMILSSPKYIDKNILYDMLQVWLGTGLLLSTGSKWHSRRKIITPAFHFKILEHFIEVFDQQNQILVETLKEKCETNEAFNIQPYICLAALDIITETSMGTKVHAQTDSNNVYVKGIAEILRIMTIRFVHPFFRDNFLLSIFRKDLYKSQNETINVLHTFTKEVIQKRRKELEESLKSKSIDLTESNEENFYGDKKRMALLDILLQSTINGEQLTDSDIREEVDTFMFEGHDTTASATCSAIYEISRNPQVQQKIVDEIKSVFGTDNSKPAGYRELMDLKYLECVIKETLRLYPPVPMIGRKFQEDVYLPSGRVIPSGSNYTINIFAAHRDEKYFPNPHQFIPERHEENLNETKDAFSFIPFSAGPRNCIGQKFAMLEMKSTLSKLLRNYEFLPLGPDMKIISNLVLRSGNGVHLGLRKRVF